MRCAGSRNKVSRLLVQLLFLLLLCEADWTVTVKSKAGQLRGPVQLVGNWLEPGPSIGTRAELCDGPTSPMKKETSFVMVEGTAVAPSEVSASGEEIQSSFSYRRCTQNICFIHIWDMTY